MYGSSGERERIRRGVDSRTPYYLSPVVDLKCNTVQPFAERSKIHQFVSLPEHSMEDPPPSQWICLAGFRTSCDPATRIDPADIAVIAAWKRSQSGKDTFVASKHVGVEADRGPVMTGRIPRGGIRVSRE